MDLQKYKNQVQETVIASMMFMLDDEDADGMFSREDVAECEQLICGYLEELAKLTDPDDAAIMQQVKALVLALNDLNERTDYSLIETEEREAVWQIIQDSAVECGLQNYSDDITEEWREW